MATIEAQLLEQLIEEQRTANKLALVESSNVDLTIDERDQLAEHVRVRFGLPPHPKR